VRHEPTKRLLSTADAEAGDDVNGSGSFGDGGDALSSGAGGTGSPRVSRPLGDQLAGRAGCSTNGEQVVHHGRGGSDIVGRVGQYAELVGAEGAGDRGVFEQHVQ
jgi:hypothetical protein